MNHRPSLAIFSVSLTLVAADGQPWKDKPAAEWSEEDARQVLTDSPWAKPVAPRVNRPSNSQHGSRGGSDRGRGGIGMGGIGIGMGGIGMGGPRTGGRGGGMGGPGMGGPGGPRGGTDEGRDRAPAGDPPTLTVRWESALPVQEAELKAHNTSAPTMDESHYAIVVLGVPARMLGGDPDGFANRLKSQVELRRQGKKPIRPSEVTVLTPDEGPVLVFRFSRNQEISRSDQRVVVKARIGLLEFEQAFDLGEMTFGGKFEM